jgi:tetratricopeptide (TPR) repeat protein
MWMPFYFLWMEEMKKQCFLSISLLLSLNLHAQSPALNDYHKLYKSGQYLKAVSSLESVDGKDNNGEKYYLLAMAYSKLQEYDKAITNFEAAIRENNPSKDLYYEYGQALYASNELKAARKAFGESATKDFNKPASLYYMAHISQILEEFNEAKDRYTDLIKNKDADNKIKQIARFQLSETMLSLLREKVKSPESLEKNVEKYILPMMRQAHKTDKSTPVATEIAQRIGELEKEFNLDPDLLLNGRRIPSKRYSGYVAQKIKFDDNISLTNEQNNVSQSKRESFIFETEAYARYDWVLKKKFIVSPEFRWNFVQHGDQDSSAVYQNDVYSLNANLKNKYEHKFREAPASFSFDIEYTKSFKDWKAQHSRIPYADSVAIGIGEQFSYFDVGETSFKLKRKSFTGETDTINNHTWSISADQTVILPTQHLLIALLELDTVDNYNNTSSSTDTYLLRFDYLIPEIMPRYTLAFALATTLTDTKEQMAQRGYETTLNPSIDLSKQINERMKISINYDFTKNKSKQSDYDYQKNVFTTEFRYSF